MRSCDAIWDAEAFMLAEGRASEQSHSITEECRHDNTNTEQRLVHPAMYALRLGNKGEYSLQCVACNAGCKTGM